MKGQTGREGAQHNKGSAAVQKRTRGKDKTEGGNGRESESDSAGRQDCGFFLGTKDLLSGRRAQAKREGIQERSEHGRAFQKA